MKNMTFLVLVAGTTAPADLERVLQSAAAAQAYLSVLVLGALPRLPVFASGMESYGVPPILDGWPEEIEATKAGLARTARTLETALAASGAEGDVGILCSEPAAMSQIVGRRAATCDAVLVSDDLRDDDALFRNAVHGALFLSPVGVILNAVSTRNALRAARIFVAWDGSLPAARAVHAALPLLRQAHGVSIGLFDAKEPSERDTDPFRPDVGQWLSRYGCTVDLRHYSSRGEEIGTCILEKAAETSADLVVMGAYGHSRMRQAIFGGTTRTLIDQTRMPVMLGH